MSAGMKRKYTRKELSRFVGKKCEAIFLASGFYTNCCNNGRLVRLSGKIKRIARMGFSGALGLVFENSDCVVFPHEVKCPALKWVGEAFQARVKKRKDGE